MEDRQPDAAVEGRQADAVVAGKLADAVVEAVRRSRKSFGQRPRPAQRQRSLHCCSRPGHHHRRKARTGPASCCTSGPGHKS